MLRDEAHVVLMATVFESASLSAWSPYWTYGSHLIVEMLVAQAPDRETTKLSNNYAYTDG